FSTFTALVCRAQAPTLRLMTHRLDVVTIRANDECPVVIRVINLPNTGRPVVCPARVDGCLVKRIDPGTRLGHECDMHRILLPGMRAEPELRLAVLAESGPAFNLHDESKPQRRKRMREESLALLVVAYREANVVDNHGNRSSGTCSVCPSWIAGEAQPWAA